MLLAFKYLIKTRSYWQGFVKWLYQGTFRAVELMNLASGETGKAINRVRVLKTTKR